MGQHFSPIIHQHNVVGSKSGATPYSCHLRSRHHAPWIIPATHSINRGVALHARMTQVFPERYGTGNVKYIIATQLFLISGSPFLTGEIINRGELEEKRQLCQLRRGNFFWIYTYIDTEFIHREVREEWPLRLTAATAAVPPISNHQAPFFLFTKPIKKKRK